MPHDDTSPYSHSAALVVWTLTLWKRGHYIELSMSTLLGVGNLETELTQMASYQQSRRSDNKWCTVEVWLDHFSLKIWRYFYFLGAFVYSHTTSYIFAMTLTLDDPVHGQETSIDSWSYLTRMANLNKKKRMYEWKRGGSTFSLSSECSQEFSCSS